MKRILLSIASLAFAGTVLATATSAFFSDTETSVANTFSAGAVDLLVDNESYATNDQGILVESPETSWSLTNLTTHKFFNFLDLKPSDWGEDTISLHVVDNDAYLCAEVTLTSNEENGINEPEALAGDADQGPGQGELAPLVNFVWWADDGDNVFENTETIISQGPIGALALNDPFTVALADSAENIWEGSGPVDGGQTYYIGKGWCFGDITLDPRVDDNGQIAERGPTEDADLITGGIQPRGAGFTCNGDALGNESQTDTLTADVSFSAVQARNNDGFLCVPDDEPTFSECTGNQKYADSGSNLSQGTQKSGAAVLANRSVVAAATGAPQTAGNPSDVGFPAGSFLSLGFKPGGPPHGSVVLNFGDNVVLDEVGADLRVYEVTGGVYPDEKITVEVSQDGVTFLPVVGTYTRDADIDISSAGLSWAQYVRITDASNIALFPNDADAYDLDAIEALHCGIPTI